MTHNASDQHVPPRCLLGASRPLSHMGVLAL